VLLWLAPAATAATIAAATAGSGGGGGVAVLQSLLAGGLAPSAAGGNCSLAALMQLLQWLRLLHAASVAAAPLPAVADAAMRGWRCQRLALGQVWL